MSGMTCKRCGLAILNEEQWLPHGIGSEVVGTGTYHFSEQTCLRRLRDRVQHLEAQMRMTHGRGRKR